MTTEKGKFGPVLWNIALTPTPDEKDINYNDGKIYNIINAKDLDISCNFIIKVLINIDRSYFYSFTNQLKLASGDKVMGEWYLDHGYPMYLGKDIIQAFAIKKLIKHKKYLLSLIKEMKSNLIKYVDDEHHGFVVSSNIINFFHMIFQDVVLTITINKTNLFIELMMLLLTAIKTYKNHERMSDLINLFTFNIIFTSKKKRKELRKKIRYNSILKSGTHIIFMYIFNVYIYLYTN